MNQESAEEPIALKLTIGEKLLKKTLENIKEVKVFDERK